MDHSDVIVNAIVRVGEKAIGDVYSLLHGKITAKFGNKAPLVEKLDSLQGRNVTDKDKAEVREEIVKAQLSEDEDLRELFSQLAAKLQEPMGREIQQNINELNGVGYVDKAGGMNLTFGAKKTES